MAAAVAATVAEEANAFGDFPNLGHQNSVSFRNQAATGRQSQGSGGGGGGPSGVPSSSFSFPAGVPLVARVVSKVSSFQIHSFVFLTACSFDSEVLHCGSSPLLNPTILLKTCCSSEALRGMTNQASGSRQLMRVQIRSTLVCLTTRRMRRGECTLKDL